MRKQMFLAITIAIMGVGASVASTAHADPYGLAGCGLGSMLFHDQRGLVQVLAATSNGTFGTQTFGISSGTSNCEETKASAQSTKSFVQANREAVSKDIARGSGETISSVSTLAGCADPAAVGNALQRDFKTIFPNAKVTDVAVSDSVVDTLRAHPELACHALS
jgi:hypothetical protein